MDYLLSFLLRASIDSQNLRLTNDVMQPASAHLENIAENTLIRLDETETQLRMESLPDWTTDGNSLFYARTFEDFVEAIDFVNSLVEPAEKSGHHPDITINYNRVSLELTTHDAGGLTELDFQLAAQISQL